MNTPRSILAILLLTAGGMPLSAEGASPEESPSPNATAAKAINFLTTKGEAWMEKRGCVSCHQIPAMLWSLGAAQRNGLDVASKSVDKWNDWSVLPVNFVKPEKKEDLDVAQALTANIDTMAALLLAIEGDTDAEWRKHFEDSLCDEQQEDGSWKACGQLPMQKRPKQETAQATTLWVTLSLLRSGRDDFDQAAAVAFADRSPAARSTEWYAVRLLVAAERADGDTPERLKQLLDLQREDGGWGWLSDQPSDALATGIALYALAQTGESETPAIRKARAYLADSIEPQGYWKVPGTKSSAKGRPTATSNYWGTAWAVVGLLETR